MANADYYRRHAELLRQSSRLCSVRQDARRLAELADDYLARADELDRSQNAQRRREHHAPQETCGALRTQD
jgi:hypothetical protein